MVHIHKAAEVIMPNDMGTFRIDIAIENPRYPGARRTIHAVLVDTGAELSWIPADILESLKNRTAKPVALPPG